MKARSIFRRKVGNSTGAIRHDELRSNKQMAERIREESARSDRSGREFSLVLFRVKRRQRFSVARHRVARVLQGRCRTTDVIGWFSDQCLCALLPDTPIEGARAFAGGICDLVALTSPRPLWAAYSYPDSWLRTDDAPDAILPKGVPTAIDRPGEVPEDKRRTRPGIAGAGAKPVVSGRDKCRDEEEDQAEYNLSGHEGNGSQRKGDGHGDGGSHATQLLLSVTVPRGMINGVGLRACNGGNGHRAPALATRPGATRGGTLGRDDLLPYLAGGLRAGFTVVDLTPTKSAPAAAKRRLPPGAPADAARTIEETPRSVLVCPMPMWKRVLDVVGAAAGLAALSPLFLAAALGVLLTSGRPIFFRQRRAGLGGEPFWIYKFRTMGIDAEQRRKELAALSEQDGPAFKLRNDPRVTPFGRLLRTTSIDELPQLWNVLKGDMSLVGPRPLPCDESDACAAWQRRRLDVTPGLTCIWQVRGRSTVTFAEWIRMDVAYMRRRTLVHDVWLLLCTVPAVLRRRGAR